MNKCTWLAVAIVGGALWAAGAELRPPSVPLVACDPYFSIWSPADKLTDTNTTHWTGKPHRLTALVRVDGKAFRVMGAEPQDLPALEQKKLSVLPTRTIYQFAGANVALTLTFLTPALPDDLDVLSWPVTYVTWEFRSTDGKRHDVAGYFEASPEIAVNEPKQRVEWARADTDALTVLKIGSLDQQVLGKHGDDLRIDWGHLYLAAPTAQAKPHLLPVNAARTAFCAGAADPQTKLPMPQPAVTAPVAALTFDGLTVGAEPVTRWLLVAYDDLFAIQYFKQNLRAYWRRHGAEAADLLKAAAAQRETLQQRCTAFDTELMADLTKAGGEQYAQICALAFRQTWAGCKLAADANGQPLVFPKENHSNGCIGTVDVIYPMAPQFLLFGPSLAKAIIVQNLDYAASSRWPWPFAPHDLGQYPQANGQVYGGGERTEKNQMPVEETGNILVLLAAVAQLDGNADFAAQYWPVLEKWAAYLKEKGFDPENQLCTDDFAGHLAHNVNLSAKAICGLASFARLCELRGKTAQAAEFQALAKQYAARWVAEANDGDHFRLAFDRPGSWSQKYNIVWDRILGFGLWPAAALRKDMDFYKLSLNPYGLPLDNRKDYTKLDWTLWTATLTQDRADFDALCAPVYRFLNETPNRSPMTDWYQTKTAQKVGFTARPVVGGVFLQMLYDKAVWTKWAGRDRAKAAHWAPLPKTARAHPLLPTAREDRNIHWQYTTQQPAADWYQPGFADAGWTRGVGGFGTPKTPGAVVRTSWKTDDIWLRREFELADRPAGQVALLMHHDEDAEVFLNGVPAAQTTGYISDYDTFEIAPAAAATLKIGKNLIAIHCHQVTGGQYIDAGLVRLEPAK